MLNTGKIVYGFAGPFGIPVQVSASALLLALFLFAMSGSLAWAAATLAILYGSVFLHELGHAWGAHVQGVPVRRIVLHGFGGFCEQARSATRHEQELIVAMGPIVNLVIWALASLAANLGMPDFSALSMAQLRAGQLPAIPGWVSFLDRLAWINLLLFLFNMLPVQPLDGGKLFHLGALRLMAPHRALRVTGWIGLVTCTGYVLVALAMFLGAGWIFFFFPSFSLHWRLARGQS